MGMLKMSRRDDILICPNWCHFKLLEIESPTVDSGAQLCGSPEGERAQPKTTTLLPKQSISVQQVWGFIQQTSTSRACHFLQTIFLCINRSSASAACFLQRSSVDASLTKSTLDSQNWFHCLFLLYWNLVKFLNVNSGESWYSRMHDNWSTLCVRLVQETFKNFSSVICKCSTVQLDCVDVFVKV